MLGDGDCFRAGKNNLIAVMTVVLQCTLIADVGLGVWNTRTYLRKDEVRFSLS